MTGDEFALWCDAALTLLGNGVSAEAAAKGADALVLAAVKRMPEGLPSRNAMAASMKETLDAVLASMPKPPAEGGA
jgi:hypothetical protein